MNNGSVNESVNNKFLYVVGDKNKETMINLGFRLATSIINEIHIFYNDTDKSIPEDIIAVRSDTMMYGYLNH